MEDLKKRIRDQVIGWTEVCERHMNQIRKCDYWMQTGSGERINKDNHDDCEYEVCDEVHDLERYLLMSVLMEDSAAHDYQQEAIQIIIRAIDEIRYEPDHALVHREEHTYDLDYVDMLDYYKKRMEKIALWGKDVVTPEDKKDRKITMNPEKTHG